jgi:hypothetical protein
MDPQQIAAIVERRRRGKRVLLIAVGVSALFLVALFAFQSIWFMVPMALSWLVACIAAAYVGRAPPKS